jgi:hypothetical protein
LRINSTFPMSNSRLLVTQKNNRFATTMNSS